MNRNRILGDGVISKAFKALGVEHFDTACEFVNGLPYKRNSTKSDPLIVLKESCGTCSSKHGIIKRLAVENEISDCKLILCMFKMSSLNTIAVAPVLNSYGLEYIPEAHTYVEIDGSICDLTFPDTKDLAYQKDVLFTEEISADQLKSYKLEKHQAYMRNWMQEEKLSYSFEELWAIREECIFALSV